MLVRLWIGIWNGSVTIWLSIWRILWIRHIWDWSLLWRGDRYGGYGTISLLSLIGGMRIIFLSWLNLRRLPTFLLQLAIKQIGRIEARSFNPADLFDRQLQEERGQPPQIQPRQKNNAHSSNQGQQAYGAVSPVPVS